MPNTLLREEKELSIFIKRSSQFFFILKISNTNNKIYILKLNEKKKANYLIVNAKIIFYAYLIFLIIKLCFQ